MSHIAIFADALCVDTSSVPCREMLLDLMRIRASDHFTLVFCKGSDEAAWWPIFEKRIDRQASWSKAVLPKSRRIYNALTLLGVKYLPDVRLNADVFLRLNAGTMGWQSRPLIQLITDLSAIRTPRTCSLKWHGRMISRQSISDGAKITARTVCISKFTAGDVAEAFPELASGLAVIPNGIADAWFEDSEPRRSPMAERPYFVWYGQITPRKNLTGMLNGYARALAIAGTKANFPNLLLIAPSGAAQTSLEASSAALGIKNRVRIIQPVPLPELIELVSQSRGLAFPSFYEGFGMPIIEAFARGVPVLTSSRTAMPETAGGHAVLCDPADGESIARGFLALANEDQLAADRVAERKAYAQNFTSLKSAMNYSALIDEVLASDA